MESGLRCCSTTSRLEIVRIRHQTLKSCYWWEIERYRQMNKGGRNCVRWLKIMREREIGVLLPLLNVLRSNLDEDKMSFFWLDPPDAINYLLINVPPWYIRGPLTPHHLISLLFFSALAISLLCTRLEEAAHGSRSTRPSVTYDITIKVGSHHLIPALRFRLPRKAQTCNWIISNLNSTSLTLMFLIIRVDFDLNQYTSNCKDLGQQM